MYARDFNWNSSGEFILKFENLHIQNSVIEKLRLIWDLFIKI